MKEFRRRRLLIASLIICTTVLVSIGELSVRRFVHFNEFSGVVRTRTYFVNLLVHENLEDTPASEVLDQTQVQESRWELAETRRGLIAVSVTFSPPSSRNIKRCYELEKVWTQLEFTADVKQASAQALLECQRSDQPRADKYMKLVRALVEARKANGQTIVGVADLPTLPPPTDTER